MSANVGLWECTSCGRQGTLITLVEMIEENGKEKRSVKHLKIYHPKEEYNFIRSSFETLIQKYGDRVEKL